MGSIFESSRSSSDTPQSRRHSAIRTSRAPIFFQRSRHDTRCLRLGLEVLPFVLLSGIGLGTRGISWCPSCTEAQLFVLAAPRRPAGRGRSSLRRAAYRARTARLGWPIRRPRSRASWTGSPFPFGGLGWLRSVPEFPSMPGRVRHSIKGLGPRSAQEVATIRPCCRPDRGTSRSGRIPTPRPHPRSPHLPP